jgi:hypothetical protein
LIIDHSSRFKFEDWLRYLTYFVWAFFFLFLCGAIFFFFSVEKSESTPSITSSVEDSSQSAHERYAAIGKGPLSLQGGSFGRVPHLSHEVIFLACNRRPDVKPEEAEILFSLRSSKEEFIAHAGQKIYLKGAHSDVIGALPLHVSRTQTSLWFVPLATALISDAMTLTIEVGVKFTEDGVEKEECAQHTLEQRGLSEEKQHQIPLPFQSLFEARCWGVDQLFKKYGGEEYKAIQEKQKIEIAHPSPYTCFVAPGDFLTLSNEQWQVVSLEEAKSNAPIARVKAMNGHNLEIEAWDEQGFFPHMIRLNQQHVPKLLYKAENLPTSFRLRTSSQVTCLFGKRRMILKQGDWLLKTTSGWHILKRVEEMEDCLQHKIKGELFIFDRLDKEEGRVILRGTLFDEMRTQVQSVEIPIAGSKKTFKQRKKKHVLSKKNVVPSRT